MKITLNGTAKELRHAMDLQSLIGQFCKNKPYVIAEVNGDIVKRPAWEKTIIDEGDNIELVNLVGGG